MPAGLPSELLERRPDIRAAEQQLIAANANIGAARAAFFPRISLTANFGTASTELSGLFKSGTLGLHRHARSCCSRSSTPAATRPTSRSPRSTATIAVAQYEKSIQTAFREVADALAGRATLGEQVRAQAAQTNALAITYRLADLRYRAGASSYLEVLDAQRRSSSSQQALVQSQALQAAEPGDAVPGARRRLEGRGRGDRGALNPSDPHAFVRARHERPLDLYRRCPPG